MIYTRTGDAGTTSLPDGTRVSKTDARIACYGALDELNAQLGLLRAQLATLHIEGAPHIFEADERLIMRAQRLLFSLDATDTLVGGIFRGFVLPGGHPVAAVAHVVRCVCRRTERELCSLSVADDVQRMLQPGMMAYINRLSDFLFALARKINSLTATAETLVAE